MTTIQIFDSLYYRLQEIGEKQNESPDQVAERILSREFAFRFCYAGECIFCGGFGQVGFWWYGDQKRMILMCEECSAIWLSPKDFLNTPETTALGPWSPDLVVPDTDCSLEGSRWATDAEIEAYGWGEFIQGKSWRGYPLDFYEDN